MRNTFTFWFDPGHAWLEVTREEATALGVINRISAYSYQTPDGKTLYLEEDCDASRFIDAYIAEFGVQPTFQSRETAVMRARPQFKP